MPSRPKWRRIRLVPAQLAGHEPREGRLSAPPRQSVNVVGDAFSGQNLAEAVRKIVAVLEDQAVGIARELWPELVDSARNLVRVRNIGDGDRLAEATAIWNSRVGGKGADTAALAERPPGMD